MFMAALETGERVALSRLRAALPTGRGERGVSVAGRAGLAVMAEPWNVNIHYDARLAACVPATARSALDVGCGDGFLAARLARRVPQVVAIDIDAAVLARARARFPDAAVRWCHGDVLTHPLAAGSFDAVVSNAALHQLGKTRAALRRLGQLVRPGGVLGVVGFTRTQCRDWPWALAAFAARHLPATPPSRPPGAARIPRQPPAHGPLPADLAAPSMQPLPRCVTPPKR